MRALQFVQVLLLLFLAGYALLVALENPLMVRLPLLFVGGELVLPAGLVLAAALLLGGLYTALLFLPGYLSLGVQRRRDQRGRAQAETRLQATLQAVVMSGAGVPAPGAGGQDAQGGEFEAGLPGLPGGAA